MTSHSPSCRRFVTATSKTPGRSSPALFAIDRLHPACAAVLGATVVSLYMQEKHGWRAGKVQRGYVTM
ncbi:MAG: hypothetical protein ACRYGA_07385 [Janthinobacterium lividum]